MLKQSFDWKGKNILDDVEYREDDLEKFKKLLGIKENKPLESTSLLTNVGEIIKGRIVGISKEYAVIDVGLKSEGVIPVSEFRDPEELVVGKEIEVLLDKAEGADGQIVLSKEKASRLKQWENIIANYKEGAIIKGKVIKKVKGGLMVDIGVESFLPGSQIDNKKIKSLDDFIDKTFDFKILKINAERKNIVVSRRELIEDEKANKKSVLLENIKEGDIRKGVVKNITDFGVFLDLDGIDGLLHITDMTWKRIRHPSEILKLGDELEVIVLAIDKDKGRVSLGLKQKENNPWEDIEKRYPIGMHVKGKIVNLVPYGAFLEIEPEVEGLIHVSEMSWTKSITDPGEIVRIGDEVEAVVLDINTTYGKIYFGMKQIQKNPWEDIDKKYPVGKKVKAEIKSLTNYGAFVELEPGIDGLIHISDVSWIKKISHPSELFKKGDTIEAVVISIDKDSQKINLGVKQLTPNPWEGIEKNIHVGDIVKGKVVKIAAFGIFVQLENGIEALIHVNDLSDQPIGKIENFVSIDDEIKAKVLNIDPEHKKISLSIKEYLIENNEYSRDDIIVGEEKEKK
ncbi:MAG: 30S ribosomal protein S1 [Chlamydiae bacterium SM23_39]|nr:MAG: 30S ribosomal protein S1 [Chlamydiae bacterium SM23_39]